MSPQKQEQAARREIMRSSIRWFAALTGVALIHPLLRFAGFTVRPKPRQIWVPAPLPKSGVLLEKDFILFAGGDTPWAVSRTCTHLGCRVNLLEGRQIIECPCHHSRFSPQGKRLVGPATKDLPVYTVEVQKNMDDRVVGYVVTI